MRRASRINDQVVGQAIAALHAGASETEIADLVERLFREKGANRSSEGQSGLLRPQWRRPHHGPDGTRLREGDSVVLDIFIPIGRY
ncbi:MAG: M24 family metallopeptidase [Intestinimonas sp.]